MITFAIPGLFVLVLSKEEMIRTKIIGTGSCIPEVGVANEAFYEAQFLEEGGLRSKKGVMEIIEKFQAITGISERRYAKPEQSASDLAFLAASDALESAGVDGETLDYLIVSHNFGDVANETNRVCIVPSLASRVKALLKIRNPDCIAYDLVFGCPGWIEGIIQASYYIRSGDARRCMVIGTETLSRMIDPHDRDAMIFADGSGAVIVEADHSGEHGIISHKSQTFATEHAHLLNMEASFGCSRSNGDLFLKMNGRRVYEFALQYVPLVVKAALDSAAVDLRSIEKVLIHQANSKMDLAILQRLFRLYGIEEIPEHIMPMTIGWLGNSSVATIPTMLDLIMKNKLNGHKLSEGETILMASVGAGMNINALVYKI